MSLAEKLKPKIAVPLVVVEDHHEAYWAWKEYEIRNAALIHIDAHHDMSQWVPLEGKTETEFPELNIANFICAAVHEGIINRAYWKSPHWDHEKIIDFRSSYEENDKGLLLTTEQNGYIIWEYHDESVFYGIGSGEGKKIPEEDINPKRSIWDIDLDAFCCGIHVHDRPTKLKLLPEGISAKDLSNWFHNNFLSYDGITGWGTRINQTGEFLDRLLDRTQKLPELVTIARSPTHEFVPYHLVDDVQYRTIEMLQKTVGGI